MPGDREVRVANALELVRRKDLDPRGVLVVRGRKGLLGAMLCVPIPGASGLVWPPQVVSRDAGGGPIEDLLAQACLQWLHGRGAKLAQALLFPEEAPLAASLERNGFHHITTLWYLTHSLNLSPEVLRAPARLSYQTYADGDPTLFAQTLLHTYEQSLDCPEVNGVREIGEILAGHRGQGAFDPERWWLALEGGRPVGVLLMMELADGQGWDLSYLGVVPAARRRGVGRELTRRALVAARQGGAFQLTLAVDARNRPARDLYQSLGFEPLEQREVFLAFLQ
jgi:mycothiol synthase